RIDDRGLNRREAVMIGVMVKFQYPGALDEGRIRKIAHEAQGKFHGMPGLRSKAFTLDPASNQALNFYIWDSEEAARKFFTPEAAARIGGLYGVPPTIQFFDVAELVDNAAARAAAE